MSGAWFFHLSGELPNSPVSLDRETLQHIRALRLQDNDRIVLADGRGRAWQARLALQGDHPPLAFIENELVQNSEPPLDVTLLAGITKGEKMDQLVRAAVELGVKKIIPVLTTRTVVQMPAAKREGRGARWQKIALAAASLCRRSYLPQVHSPLDFDAVLPLIAEKELVIVPWEEEKERGLLSLLQDIKAPPREVLVFTGPEGGITALEMEQLERLTPVRPVSLGPRILSAQHAPLAALSVIMALWGDLGGK